MAKPLVIVESPAKARTIENYLGKDFIVESSVGHIRDLPAKASELPEKYRQEKWANFAVDIDHNFKPIYVISANKQNQVKKLKKLLSEASELYLATDEDREGESIAWHLLEVLNPKIPVKRMVFHEITKEAILSAVDNWRELDRRLVDAQETRRILDRLYGYELSPVLWKKVMTGLSAGRVQSVAIRMIVEREKQRIKFKSASWWDLTTSFKASKGSFLAGLTSVNQVPLAAGKDFDENGNLTKDVLLLDEQKAQYLKSLIEKNSNKDIFNVVGVESRPFRRSPAAPFMTSTLQQEAGRKLKFSATRTMSAAQTLYEQGWITYMRTDSVVLSDQALQAARRMVENQYGKNYLPDSPRKYTSKVKNAQEAHEAIRPASDHWKTPNEVKNQLSGDLLKVYELIFKRTVASQMKDATGHQDKIRIKGQIDDPDYEILKDISLNESSYSNRNINLEFSATGRVIDFPGFLAAYEDGNDDDNNSIEEDSNLPKVTEGENLKSDGTEIKDHATTPPARFTEASLIKALEEMGVGRPSTYASIIDTIQRRKYIWKKGTALVPAWVAFAVVDLLENFFPKLVDYNFTAQMEDSLDQISEGTKSMVPYLKDFYFGTDKEPGLVHEVQVNLGEIDAREINSILIGKDSDGNELVVRVGRYGPFIQYKDITAAVPEDLAPDELNFETALSILKTPNERVLGEDPQTGLEVTVKSGRFGPYVQRALPEDAKKSDKPKYAALFKSMDPKTISLEDALKLLSLPRNLGLHPETNEPIVAKNGRFGPYIECNKDSRSLDSEEELLTVDLNRALELLAAPKKSRWQTRQSASAVVLGTDPNSQSSIQVKSGRFGPYVTDGTTNASLRKGDDPTTITLERAAELLAERRASQQSSGRPVKKKVAKKAAVKKTTAKKTTAKKTTAKKTTVKKTTAKKTVAKKTVAKKSLAEKPSTEKPSTEKPSTEKPSTEISD